MYLMSGVPYGWAYVCDMRGSQLVQEPAACAQLVEGCWLRTVNPTRWRDSRRHAAGWARDAPVAVEGMRCVRCRIIFLR